MNAMKTLVLGLILLIPSLALAAYQNPTITANQPQGNGSTVITFQFAGNAGEPTVTRQYQVSQDTTVTAIRNWVDDTIKELDLVYTARTSPSAQPGQVVPRLARTSPPPTAKQIWREKFDRWKVFTASGLTNAALTTDLDALKADLEATYVDGFID